MDGKYAKYIQSPYGFICDYDVQDGKVVIYTSKSKKGKPHTYDATKENISSSEKRLEKQYQLLNENKDEIKKDICRKVRCTMYRFIIAAMLVTGSAYCLLTAFSMPVIATAIMFCLELVAIGVGEISLATWRKHFDEAIEAYEKYMEERANIETLSKTDTNVTQYLSERTQSVIEENRKLQQSGQIEQIFNINLMDKSSLKDLKMLLERYQISTNLGTDPHYCAPETVSKSKKKARIKEQEIK